MSQLEDLLKGWLNNKQNDIIKCFITKSSEHGLLNDMEKILAAHSIPPDLRESSIGPEEPSTHKR